MGTIEHIRKAVLGITQADFGAIVGVTQATVSRWENGEGAPSLDEMSRIRDEAKARGIAWDDDWFFDSPPQAPNDSHDDQNAHGDEGSSANAGEVIS